MEEEKGKITGYEIKWGGEVKKRVVREFLGAYPGAEVETVNKDNFEKFLGS